MSGAAGGHGSERVGGSSEQGVYRTPEEWAVVVEQIRSGDPKGEEALYASLAGGAGPFERRAALLPIVGRRGAK